MSKKQQQWQPLPSREQGKLAPKEGDWNLAGAETPQSRTRFGGEGRPRNRIIRTYSSSSSSDGSFLGIDSSSSEEDVMMVDDHDDRKPPPSRVIVEVEQLKRTMEEFSSCKTCRGPLEVSLNAKGFGLATKIELSCLDRECTFVHHGQLPSQTKVHDLQADNYDRVTDYAINCIFVIAFLSSGDGCTEAARLLGLLGLPNDTTMESTSFKKIEERIGPFIRELGDDVLLENLKEETKLSVSASDYDQWERSIDPAVATPELPKERYPVIDGSFDNAWQQKSAGRKHDSPSGHGLIFGNKSRKPIGCEIKSKICDWCTGYCSKNPGVDRKDYPVHDCTKNYEGSSGGMESKSCLELITRLFEKHQVQIGRLCCDDDSSIRADCQWNNATYLEQYNLTVLPKVKITKGPNKGKLQDRPDKGLLDGKIAEPTFVCDPNHRGKNFTGECYALDIGTVTSKATMTRMDTTRLGKNFKYMARTLKHTDPSQYVTTAKAVLEHHFDNHEFCNDTWCRRKKETPEERQKSKRYYRDKKEDKALYDVIEAIMEKYITQERLADMAHGMDTNANESFNNTVSWFAPKNKVYCGSRSLWNRVAIAIGIQSLGYEEYYKRLFKKLGIQVTANVLHFLKVKNHQRSKRLRKQLSPEKKLLRNKRKFDKQRADELIAKKERLTRCGKYRRGMNLDITAEEIAALPVRFPAKKRSCPHPFCGLKGHSTTKSKNCKANPERLKREGLEAACAAAVAAAAANPLEETGVADAAGGVDAADDIAQHDALKLEEDDDSSLDIFQDTGTWSEDENGNCTGLI